MFAGRLSSNLHELGGNIFGGQLLTCCPHATALQLIAGEIFYVSADAVARDVRRLRDEYDRGEYE